MPEPSEQAVVIRPAVAADVPELGRLGAMLVAAHHAFDPKRFFASSDGTAAANMLRSSPASFVIARFGGPVVPDEDAIAPLATALECPLFLVR